jgi:excisionase family DNA binding protein
VTGIVVAADEPLYTTAQVADRLQLPVSTIRGAIRSGRLRAYLPAGRRHGYRIAESAIQEFLRASTVANTQGAGDAP